MVAVPPPPKAGDTVSAVPGSVPGTAIDRGRCPGHKVLRSAPAVVHSQSEWTRLTRRASTSANRCSTTPGFPGIIAAAARQGRSVMPSPLVRKMRTGPLAAPCPQFCDFPVRAACWVPGAGQAGPAFPDRRERNKSPACHATSTTELRNVRNTSVPAESLPDLRFP